MWMGGKNLKIYKTTLMEITYESNPVVCVMLCER